MSSLIIAVAIWCGQMTNFDNSGYAMTKSKKDVQACRDRVMTCLEAIQDSKRDTWDSRTCFKNEKY